MGILMSYINTTDKVKSKTRKWHNLEFIQVKHFVSVMNNPNILFCRLHQTLSVVQQYYGQVEFC